MSHEDDLRSRALTLLRIAVGIAASAGLGWLAARGLDWAQVAEAFGSVSLPLIALAVVVFMAASYLRAARWRVLFVNDEVSTNRLFVIQNVGIGLNNVMPVRIASEASQLAILSLKEGVRPSVALATLGMERVLDVIASTLILAIAFFMVPEMSRFAPYVWGALGLSVVCIALVRILAWGNTKIPWIERVPGLTAFTTAVRDLERQRLRLCVSTAMSIGYWLVVGLDRVDSRQLHRPANHPRDRHNRDNGHDLLRDRGPGRAVCHWNVRVRYGLRAGVLRRGPRDRLRVRSNHSCGLLFASDANGRHLSLREKGWGPSAGSDPS